MRNSWTQYKIDHVVQCKVSDYLIVAMYSPSIGYIEPIAYGIFRERKGGTEREFLSNLSVTKNSPNEVVLNTTIRGALSMVRKRKTGGQS